MSADRVSYTLDSTLETVNNAEETASRMAAEAGFDDEEVMKISDRKSTRLNSSH